MQIAYSDAKTIKRQMFFQSKIVTNKWVDQFCNIEKHLNAWKKIDNKRGPLPVEFHKKIVHQNQWYDELPKSYRFNISKYNLDDEDEVKKMRAEWQEQIVKTRQELFNRLVYLLDIWREEKKKPMPLDLAYLMNLNSFEMDKCQEYDKNWEYDRKMLSSYYLGPAYKLWFLFPKKETKMSEVFFFDPEDDESFDIKRLKLFQKNNLDNGEVSEPNDNYIMRKACRFDKKYNYNRILSSSYYDEDKYFEKKEEKEIVDDDYYEVDDYSEPEYDDYRNFDGYNSISESEFTNDDNDDDQYSSSEMSDDDDI